MNRRGFLRVGLWTIAASAVPAGILAWIQPGEIKLYDVAGQTAFPHYGTDGGLTAEVSSFLVCRRGDNVYSYGFDPRLESEADLRKLFEKGIEQLEVLA